MNNLIIGVIIALLILIIVLVSIFKSKKNYNNTNCLVNVNSKRKPKILAENTSWRQGHKQSVRAQPRNI